MRIAIPNGGPQDGVRLLADEHGPPWPDGAILPIRNWNELVAVPAYYRVVDGDAVRVMTPAERKAVDNNRLDEIKAERKDRINASTSTMMLAGLRHPDKPGVIFGFLSHDQRNLLGLETNAVAGADLTGQFYKVDSIDGVPDQFYYFDDNADFARVAAKAKAWVAVLVQTGGALKQAVDAASDIDELDAVVDDRTWDSMDRLADEQLP